MTGSGKLPIIKANGKEVAGLERYERNRDCITPAQQALLADKSVLVAGCGGLGGYVLEYLGRLGVGRLTAVDGDVFVP